jgi:hypothetical protein
MTGTSARSKASHSRGVKFPGITEAARVLGVNRYHLREVLAGRRQSRSLIGRYEAYLKGQSLQPSSKTTKKT